MSSEWDRFATVDEWERFARADKATANGSRADSPSGEDLMKQQRRTLANQVGGLVRGAGSIGATILSPIDIVRDAMAGKGLSLESNRQRRADMDAALQNLIGADPASTGYQVAKTASEVAGTLGVGGALARGAQAVGAAPKIVTALQSAGFTTGAAPTTARGKAADLALRTVVGAIPGGISAGLVNPDDALQGAVIGGIAPGAVKGSGAVAGALGRALRPNVSSPELAAKAINQYGIPLGPADISASGMTKAAKSVLDDALFTGGIGRRHGEAVQQAYNRAIGRTFGADEAMLTGDVVDAAKKRMGSEFDRLWNRNALTVDVDFAQQLAELQKEAAKLPQGESARLTSWLEDIASKAIDDGAGNFVIPGDVANRLQSKLGREASSAQGFLKDALGTLRSSMLQAFNRGITPEDVAALSKVRGQYKAFKTVEPLLQGAEAGVAGREAGNVPAALLPQAVRKSYKSGIASSPFADLSQIGSQYVADRVARTGGSNRAMFQNTSLAAGLLMATNPWLAAAVIPSVMGTQKALGSPTVANALLRSGQHTMALPPELQALLFRAAPVIGGGL